MAGIYGNLCSHLSVYQKIFTAFFIQFWQYVTNENFDFNLKKKIFQLNRATQESKPTSVMVITTVLPESIYPFTEVLPWTIHRLTQRSRLSNDTACQNFTEVLPRFFAAQNTVANGKLR